MNIIIVATTDIPAGTYSTDDWVFGAINPAGDTIELTLGVAAPVPVSPPPVSPPPPPVSPPLPPPVSLPPPPPVSPPPPPVPPATGVGLKNEVLALGMAVSYQDYSTPPAGLTITGYSWAFNDGVTATSASGQHLFDTAGTYNVTETVTYSDGTTATQTTRVVVGLVPQIEPDGLSILYHLDDNSFVEGIDWDFGDGSHAIGGGAEGTGASGRHSYASLGTYNVSGIVRYKGSARADAFGPVAVTVSARWP